MLSLLLTTPLPQLGLRNVTVTWGIAAKMSSRGGDLDKRCHPTEEATRGQSALGCRQRVAEMLLELRGPRSCRGAFGSAARASAISSAPRHAGLDGGGLNPPTARRASLPALCINTAGSFSPPNPCSYMAGLTPSRVLPRIARAGRVTAGWRHAMPSSLAHLHAPGIEGELPGHLRGCSRFGCILFGVGFFERHLAGSFAEVQG